MTSHKILRTSLHAFSLATLLALAPASRAVTATWTGGGDNFTWNDGANWQGGVPPASADPSLTILMAAPSITTQNIAPFFTLHTLDYGLGLAASQLTGGTLIFDDLGAGAPSQFIGRGTVVDNDLQLNNTMWFLGYQGTTLNGAISGTGNVKVFAGPIFNGPISTTGALNFGDSNWGGDAVVNGAITNAASISSDFGTNYFAGSISGSMPFIINPGNFSGGAVLTGLNSYTGGTTVNSGATGAGNTDGIQGNWTLNNGNVNFTQNIAGTTAANFTGSGTLNIQGTGHVTLTGAINLTGTLFMAQGNTRLTITNSNTIAQGGFYPGVVLQTSGTFAPNDRAWLGFGNDNAVGTADIGTMAVINPALGDARIAFSAEGGARTLSNRLFIPTLAQGMVDFRGTNNLTFTNTTVAHNLAGIMRHQSTAVTTLGGSFLGQNTSTIDVLSGQLVLGQNVNNGFRTDGIINVASGATLQMISNSPVKLGPTNLAGGTLVAANGVAVPTGLALTATGNILGRVSSEAGSLIEATGPLTMGDAASFGGFFSNGELREMAQDVTLLDKNQAVLGSLTEVGTTSTPGLLTAVNGVFVDFGRAITGYGIVAGTNALPQATIINGDAAGLSSVQPLDFTGYVKGIGTFTDVNFSGTFSPGLSPAIVPVNNVSFGSGNTLLMEIGGLSPGNQHDQLDIGGLLGLNGLLDVDLTNGFNPVLGDYFNILDGPTSGAFSNFSFPSLNPGLSWGTSDLYTLGNLRIVPEPSSLMLLLAGLGALLRRRHNL